MFRRVLSRVFPILVFFQYGLFLYSCDGDSSASEEQEQEIYFIFEHHNSSWGYVHQGFYINSAGELHVFNVEEGEESPGQSVMFKSELEDLLAATTSYYGETIDLAEFNQMIELIPQLEQSIMSEVAGGCSDSGTTAFVAFTYDPIANVYNRVDISIAGYLPKVNLNDATPILLDWIHPYVLTYMADFLPSIIGCDYEPKVSVGPV